MRIHRHMIENHRDYCVQFEAEPVSWTEVPVTAKVLRSQHKRWHRGLWETLWEYRRMLFNPRYGRVELVLVVLGFALGVVNSPYALMFLAVACGYAILVNPGRQGRRGATFHKHTRWPDLGAILLASVLENVGYRQATAWWRLEGWRASLRGKKQVWGTMTRQGFDDESRAATAVNADD